MSNSTALPLVILTENFAKLPGIGMKTAERLAYYVMQSPKEYAESFAAALIDVKNSVTECKICCNFSESEICGVCKNPKREASTICVVTTPKDIESFERTNEYHGVYHVLHGLLSPMDNIRPDDIRIKELLIRLQTPETPVKEVIMATNPTVEGEATAMYIARLLKPLGIKVTRIALGIPVGSSLEYADSVTLWRAIQNRNEL
ncbi:MAG: recombination mediator RecR [Ruminococcus sp.]|jgi:recombination protein RecR|nr:recombination mediator RecR [Ruminococcus sp.]